MDLIAVSDLGTGVVVSVGHTQLYPTINTVRQQVLASDSQIGRGGNAGDLLDLTTHEEAAIELFRSFDGIRKILHANEAIHETLAAFVALLHSRFRHRSETTEDFKQMRFFTKEGQISYKQFIWIANTIAFVTFIAHHAIRRHMHALLGGVVAVVHRWHGSHGGHRGHIV